MLGKGQNSQIQSSRFLGVATSTSNGCNPQVSVGINPTLIPPVGHTSYEQGAHYLQNLNSCLKITCLELENSLRYAVTSEHKKWHFILKGHYKTKNSMKPRAISTKMPSVSVRWRIKLTPTVMTGSPDNRDSSHLWLSIVSLNELDSLCP